MQSEKASVMGERTNSFRETLLSGVPLAGTFLKTPAYELVEVLAGSKLDFLCLDAEHAPFDRARMDACLAVARALDVPVLVRPGSSTPENILQALDSGAVGIVAPHITSKDGAEGLAKAGRFGHRGRGYAGSSRWAGFATRSMRELLDQSAEETVLIAQIEDPEGLDVCEDIAATHGVDGLFLGPADLSVAWGYDHQTSDQLKAAQVRVADAARAAGKASMTFVANAAQAQSLAPLGYSCFFMGSEHGWMRAGANADAEGVHQLRD